MHPPNHSVPPHFRIVVSTDASALGRFPDSEVLYSNHVFTTFQLERSHHWSRSKPISEEIRRNTPFPRPIWPLFERGGV